MIRFGIIGTNWITDAFLQAARKADDFVLTSVYSRSEDRARSFASKWGASHEYTDLEAFAASPHIDAVYIASPTSLHADQSILCMRHGKHVLCEKPLASNAREAAAMAKVAADHQVLLMEALKTPTMPNFEAITEHLPRIGKVRRYVGNYGQYSSRYDAYKQGTILNAFNPAYSNGSLMDLGVYCIYPLVALFGPPERIQANGLLLESGVDGEGCLLLSYPDMEAVIMHSKISNSHTPSEIQGELGSLIIDKISQPGRVELYSRDGTKEDVSSEQDEDTMIYELREFIGVLQRGERESSINTHRRSIQTLSIMDEARRQIGLVFPADLK
ncbi:Predicted dehydrogenase [Paenibacillus sp. UNCCL117]|uniref:Gfo/Idh/MocA family protein n=1 Tax=unclassified Paenibacillus TaxID=185978 RepID=UPI000891B9A7|nr:MULTISPECIES: Gfo/Idh/MocA family oxidoreductase [unclassified Paenibacillus]SDD92923.1 Predicted dehydrogenase [Paenibacillus sp. cl123]SFW43346.1 Predicted dehydrogenase [Paenibacillus sp. UNCCL117]